MFLYCKGSLFSRHEQPMIYRNDIFNNLVLTEFYASYCLVYHISFLLRRDLAQRFPVRILRKAGTGLPSVARLPGSNSTYPLPGGLRMQILRSPRPKNLWHWGLACCVLSGSLELEKRCLRYLPQEKGGHQSNALGKFCIRQSIAGHIHITALRRPLAKAPFPP